MRQVRKGVGRDEMTQLPWLMKNFLIVYRECPGAKVIAGLKPDKPDKPRPGTLWL